MINLKETYGKKYKITYDPAYDPKGKHVHDPAMMQLEGYKGTIYPYSDTMRVLAIESNYHPSTNAQLHKMGLKCIQDGDNEKTYLCRYDDRIST